MNLNYCNLRGVAVHKIITAILVSSALVFTSVAPGTTFAASKPTAAQLNSHREVLRLIQLAIREEVNVVNDAIRDLQRDLRAAETRAERRAILAQLRPLRAQSRRLTNRLRLSRRWTFNQIRYWAGIYLPPDVSPA